MPTEDQPQSPPPARPGARPSLGDLLAGLSVALVLVPQSLAYAELAGVPPHLGLYASAAAPILAAFFASSPYLQTGPTAMTSLLTLGALTPLAVSGESHYVRLAVLLALMVGVVRLALGVVRAGAIANLLSRPVILGFTVGAAALIFASQLPAALGVSGSTGGVGERAWSALTHPGAWNPRAVVITALALLAFLGGRRLHPRFPGVLIAAAGGLAYSVLAAYDGPTIGAVPRPQLPSWDLPIASAPSLLLPSLLIAVVGFAEPAAIARTFASMDRTRWDASREMISQGVANIGSAMSGGFPVGGSFSRSALGRLAGTRSRWSGAITGIAVLLFIPVARVLAPLPRAILAAIVIASVVGLLRKVSDLVAMWRQSRPQASIAVATLALTLLLSPHVEYAVLAGVCLSVAVHLWRELSVSVTEEPQHRALTLRLNGVLWFGSAALVEGEFNAILAQYPTTESIVIDLGGLGRIDYSGAVTLKGVLEDARASGLSVCVQGQPPQCVDLLRRVCGDALDAR